MADDDFDDYDDDSASPAGNREDAELLDELMAEQEGGPEDDGGLPRLNIRDWFNRKRGWILIIGLAIAQALFATIMIFLRSDRTISQVEQEYIQDLAVEMLGYEVKYGQIYQLVPMRGGKKMTVGLDLVLVLGQLPEEQVAGAERPTPEEFELFVSVLHDMEPRIRSRVNQLLQQMPADAFGTVEAYKVIKEDVRKYANDILEGLDFGKSLRSGIGKRRVTDVLLPMFVRQMM